MVRNVCVLALGAVLLALAATATADEPIKGKYRIFLVRGTVIEGDVTEQPDGSYVVENVGGRKGITMTVRRNQVARVEAVVEPGPKSGESLAPQPGSARRRAIMDEEIEEILSGISADVDQEAIGVDIADLEAPLPLNDESVREMKRMAGSEKTWVTPHFVMVYTGPDGPARELGARLEAVWRWNVKFIKLLQLPARRPDYKLEIYFFSQYKEFASYALNLGTDVSGGVLGFYRPDIHRSHFFDMETWPPVADRLDRVKNTSAPGSDGRRVRNMVTRWVDFMNVGVVQHEAGHHIHFSIGLFPRNGLERESSIPIWLVEGTTMLFEFPPSLAGGGIGAINHDRLNQVRQMLRGRRWSAQEWKLFMIDNANWRGGASYPPAWSMVNFLWHRHRDNYAKYLRAVFGREPDFRMTMTEREAELEQFFGRIDDDWIKQFYEYLDELQLKRSLLPPDFF